MVHLERDHAGENFAEKWNRRPERAEAFFTWHVRFCADIAALPTVRGIDRLGEKLTNLFGQKPANDAIANITEQVSTARMTGNLRVAPKVGLRSVGGGGRRRRDLDAGALEHVLRQLAG